MWSCVCKSPSKFGNYLNVLFKKIFVIWNSNTVLCSHLSISIGDEELWIDRLPPVTNVRFSACGKISLQVWWFLATSVDTVVWSTLLGFGLLLIVNVKTLPEKKNSTNSTVLLYECSQSLDISSCFNLLGDFTGLPVASCRFAWTHTLKHNQKPWKIRHFIWFLQQTGFSKLKETGKKYFWWI